MLDVYSINSIAAVNIVLAPEGLDQGRRDFLRTASRDCSGMRPGCKSAWASLRGVIIEKASHFWATASYSFP